MYRETVALSDSDRKLAYLAGAGAGGALGLLVVAVFAIRSCGADRAPAAAAATNPGAEAATAGLHARGTNELRQLGCDTALVMDMKTLLGDAAALRPGEPRIVVTCDVAGASAPTCDRAAGAYFAALGGNADGNVNVRVGRPGTRAPICSAMYAPSGARID